jgi:hypothetical protein
MTATVRSLLALGCSILAIFNLASCNTIPAGPGGAITKVKSYKLDPAQRLNTTNPMISFERQNRLYGTVSRADQMQRAGQYYTIFWKATDRTQPVTLRLEYRQRNTGLTVHKIDSEVTNVRGSNVTEFQVTGDAYTTDGPVTAYRVVLVRGKTELASADSFLWK